MDKALKILVAAACVAIIAFVAVSFMRDGEERQARERQEMLDRADRLIEDLERR